MSAEVGANVTPPVDQVSADPPAPLPRIALLHNRFVEYLLIQTDNRRQIQNPLQAAFVAPFCFIIGLGSKIIGGELHKDHEEYLRINVDNRSPSQHVARFFNLCIRKTFLIGPDEGQSAPPSTQREIALKVAGLATYTLVYACVVAYAAFRLSVGQIGI